MGSCSPLARYLCSFVVPHAGSGGGRGECSGACEKVTAATSSSCGFPADAVAVDEDGDLVLDRRRKNRDRSDHVITVQHGITSSLRSVGLQVWKAALLLTDFVLHKSFTSSEFNGVTAIEIGAGTGLVGLALARVARKIFITDRGTDILDNCLENVRLNSSMLKFDEAKAYVRELDWKVSWPPPVFTGNTSNTSSRYLWSTNEIEAAEEATALFAADVIYSDDLTDLFFSTAKELMSRGAKKVLYLTLEKRYNFSLDELDVVANGYEHFRSFFTVQDESGFLEDNTCRPGFVGKQMNLADVPQYIREYDRGKDLEMWKISRRMITRMATKHAQAPLSACNQEQTDRAIHSSIV
ncbi:methyltransferase-like protein 22 isoform X2 [Oryza brachyantha]|uniref:methyltransferase-like protein 22 isoform X2 n=1 Tax=Oryza brachyantha TaxID=4533 RepID=UPI000776388D|nr:methyltransferase-like protein 22 isoform X2 [Oryza brachyantha]